MNFFLNCFTKYSLTFIIITIANNLNAQLSNEVLLNKINSKGVTKDAKFQYLCDISFNYADIDSTKAYNYASKALEIAKQSNSLKKEIIAYDCIATVAKRNDNIRKQILIADKCTLLAKDSNDEEIIAYCDFLNAYKYYLIDDEDKYVFYILKSFNFFEKVKKRYDKLVSGYSILSRKFLENENMKIFEKYAKKALVLGIESNNDIYKVRGLNIWATYLFYKAEDSEVVNKKLLDSASNYFLKAIKIIESKKQYVITCNRDHARSYINLAGLYLSNFLETKQTEKGLQYLKKGEDISIKNNNTEALVTIYGIRSNFYLKTKKITEAEQNLKNIERYITNKSEKNPVYGIRLYIAFMELSKIKNDFTTYQKYFLLYDKARTYQHNKENNATIYNASIRFESQEKSKQIKSLKLISEERKKVNYLLIILSILGLLTIVFMYKIFKYRRNIYVEENKSRLQTIENEAISTMLELEIANRERKIAIQEKILTEKQKEQIHLELMKNNLQLENKKEILNDIKQKLSLIKTSEVKQISRTINKSIEIDEEFVLLESSFENTNPIFFLTLQDKATNSLTKLDLKYCGYIKLRMGTKEIARIMNIEPKSMKMARYRLRQKLNLKKEEDLDDFINSI